MKGVLILAILLLSGCANMPETLPAYWHDMSDDCKKAVPPMPQYAKVDVNNGMASADSGGKMILEVYGRARRCLRA